MTELPMVIINVQRGGPSTGLPTKTEQADLYQAILGRNGECPMPVLAPRSPADCFDVVIEAVRIAVRHMTPVMVLSDGFIANGAEPWRIPNIEDIPEIPVHFLTREDLGDDPHLPYKRDEETLGRTWAIPGTPQMEHRIGGLEKDYLTGNVNYVPENHFRMVRTRAEKVDSVAKFYAPLEVEGPESGPVLVLGWGSTYGSITGACEAMRAKGMPVANLHLRNMHPLPPDLGAVLERYEKVLVPELNMGQLTFFIRATLLRDVISLPKVMGKPFRIEEIISKVEEILDPARTA
jgi:2-oxoglutarate ferredoxin oxidoreductase subunit alpha